MLAGGGVLVLIRNNDDLILPLVLSKPPEVEMTLGGCHCANSYFLDFPVIASITIL